MAGCACCSPGNCCEPGLENNYPTLHVTVAGSSCLCNFNVAPNISPCTGSSGSASCDFDGTYALTWASGSIWTFQSTAGGTFIQITFSCTGSGGACTYLLQFEILNSGASCPSPVVDAPCLCISIQGCGSTAGTWSTAQCSPPSWISNATGRTDPSDCLCTFSGTVTFTIGP